MRFKVIGLIAALAMAAPIAATAAPASGLTAQSIVDVTSAPRTIADAAVGTNDAAPKIEKVWWRGRGWRGRGWGWRRPFGFYGYGFRRPFIGYYGWRRPFWRRRWYY